jgi:ribosomal protein S27E
MHGHASVVSLDIALRPDPPLQSRWAIIFRPAALFNFSSASMTNIKAGPVTQNPQHQFKIVCINCDALGIVFDCPEGAPSSTQIKCRECGALRGTLGDLRNLSCSDRLDLFDL